MTRQLTAAFAGPRELAAVWSRMRQQLPVDPSRLEVRSSTPMPVTLLGSIGLDPGRRWRMIVPAAVLGGLAGGLTAFLIATQTALDYPLPTGGMPIVAGPPIGIITYEGAALGAILATVAAVFFAGGLLRRWPAAGPLDHLLAEGRVLVRIETRPERAVRTRETLLELGALEVVEGSGDVAAASAPGGVPGAGDPEPRTGGG